MNAAVIQTKKRRHLAGFSGMRSYATLSAYGSLALIFIILATLFWHGGPGLFAAGDTLLSTQWHPDRGQYGIIPMLYGSVIVMIIAMVIAVPTGLLTAVYLSQTRSDRLRRSLRSALEILAGVPSIVYGLLGVAYVSVWVADGFDLQTGRLILTAGLILSVMVLPTFMSLTEDALSNVPRELSDNAAALGLYRHEIVTDVVLPAAKRDIMGAGLLALGRALGETMAVMLVIGSLDRLPSPLFNVLSSGQTITSKLGREIGESAFGSTHFNVLVLMSLILVVITLALTMTAHRLLAKQAHA